MRKSIKLTILRMEQFHAVHLTINQTLITSNHDLYYISPTGAFFINGQTSGKVLFQLRHPESSRV